MFGQVLNYKRFQKTFTMRAIETEIDNDDGTISTNFFPPFDMKGIITSFTPEQLGDEVKINLQQKFVKISINPQNLNGITLLIGSEIVFNDEKYDIVEIQDLWKAPISETDIYVYDYISIIAEREHNG